VENRRAKLAQAKGIIRQWSRGKYTIGSW